MMVARTKKQQRLKCASGTWRPAMGTQAGTPRSGCREGAAAAAAVTGLLQVRTTHHSPGQRQWVPVLFLDLLRTQQPSGRQNCMKHRNTYLYDLSFAVVFETPQALLLTPWRRSWSRGCRIPELFHHLLGRLSCTTLLCHPVYREQLQVYGGNFSAEGRDTILNQLLPPLPFFNLQRHFLTSWNSP